MTPYAFVQVLPGFGAPDYGRVVSALGTCTFPGLLVHLAGPCEDGWRIIQVWESEDAYARFEREHLWQALSDSEAMAAGTAPPLFEWLEVQHVIAGAVVVTAAQLSADAPSSDAP